MPGLVDERGKSGASLGKALEAANALGLEVMVVPREHGARLSQCYRRLLAGGAAVSESDTEQP